MDTFGITVAIIVATTLVASYLRRITRDKCLKNFEGFNVSLELADGTKHTGKLEVESTGLEVIFTEEQKTGDIHRMSHILYKEEFGQLVAVLRYHDELTEKGTERRNAELKKTYHPGLLRRTKRKISNFFKMIKDSLIEIANTLSGKLKTGANAALVAGSEKYAMRLNQEIVNTIDASYDPLLEKYIGNIVAVQTGVGENSIFMNGILKEYTQNFIELLDVSYRDGRMCDCVLPRRLFAVRGLGENGSRYSIFSVDFDIRRYKKFFGKINVMKRNQGNDS